MDRAVSKATGATAYVASQLLAIEPGSQIPTTAQLAGDLQVGYGTIHAALQALQADGVVKLSTHGQQGTRLVERDLVRLWETSSRESLVGVLPLPQSIEFAGLATAAATLADKAGLPLQLTFRQGAIQRFALLRERRVDWVLCSGSAAAAEASWCDSVLLPEHTYYSHDSVVVLTAAGGSPDPLSRVAIDHHSYDHTALTLAEFPDAQHVEAAYWWIPEMIVNGAVDAAVWHQTSSSTLVTATGLSVHPLRNPAAAASSELGRAALAFRSEDATVRTVLSTFFDPDQLADIQQSVMAHRTAAAF